MDSLTLKCHNSFQNQNNGKAAHIFTPKHLMFKLRPEASKFDDICESWSFPKIEVLRMSIFLNSNF